MKINKALNLVIPLVDPDNKVAVTDPETKKVTHIAKTIGYAHSTPVSSNIWEQFWEPISMAFTRIMTGGHNYVGGPRIADKMLQKVATQLGVWDGADGVAQGLVAEALRLTNVLLPGEKGWTMHTYHEVKTKTLISKEDQGELEAAIIFFTLSSLMHRRGTLRTFLDIATSLWDAQIVSSSAMEFMNSLQTSSAPANSGATSIGRSPPAAA